jgi:hypothetical protein
MRLVEKTCLLFASVTTLALAASCASDGPAHGPPERATVSSAPITVGPGINPSPTITTFVLYAERSAILGAAVHAIGGDIGVAGTAPSSFGPQLRIGKLDGLDPFHKLYAASVSLAPLAVAGDIETNMLQNDGGFFDESGPFPASAMPLLPLAVGAPPGTKNVSVAPSHVQTLEPGAYGTLTDDGVLLLDPGTYSFASVTLGRRAELQAKPGGATTVYVAGALSVGPGAQVFPLRQTAASLAISVAGSDGPGGSPPAVSISAGSRIVALVSAPHGTLSLGDEVLATGAFAGFDVRVGSGALAIFQDGFSTAAAYPHGQQALTGELPAGIRNVPVVGAVPGAQNVTLTIGLPLTHQAELQALIANLYDPTSPQYRQYLTPAQFGAQFGAQSDYDTLVGFAGASGLAVVATYPSRALLAVTAPASVIESIFFVSLNMYQRADGSTFYAPANEPSTNLSVPVLHVTGFDSYTVAHPADGTGPSGCGIQPTQKNYVGNDMRTAYLPCTTLDGTGQSIALVEFDSYLDSTVQGYANQWLGGLVPSVVKVQVPASAPPFTPDTISQVEVPVDIEMAMSMAPKATIYVYEENAITSTSPVVYSINPGMMLAQIAGDDVAQVISCSWIWRSIVLDPNIQNLFQELAVQGQSFFQAAGDGGSYFSPVNAGPAVPEPLIDTSLITVVGGTLLTTGPLAAPPRSETTWKDTNPTIVRAAGGGGFATGYEFIDNGMSVFYPTLPIPSYQVNVNPANLEIVGVSSNPQIPGNMSQARMLPDVSIVADELAVWYDAAGNCDPTSVYCQPSSPTGYEVACANGTSLATPLWAGVAALANESLARQSPPMRPIGFANESLYALAAAGGASYGANFYDVADGSNNNLADMAPLEYHAVAGYDLATGLGTPQCAILSSLTSGACTGADLSSDPNNCGACGHGCLGGACTNGFCQPSAVAPVPSGSTGWSLTVDPANVYYATFQGNLYSCPKTGCTTPTTLVSGLNSPDSILYDTKSNDIFIADTDDNDVDSYTTTGSLVWQDAPQEHPTALTSDANYLYWSISGGIIRSTRDGQTRVQIATGVPVQIASLTLDPAGGTIYAALIGDTGAIIRASIDSTGAWSYFAGTNTFSQPYPNQISVQGSTVYWITQGTSTSGYTNGGVHSCPTTGCSSPTAIAGTTPLTQGTCLFTDSTYLHYVANGSFYRCSLTGCSGGPTLTASGNVMAFNGASGCTEDPTSYYFIQSVGPVLRIAK